MLFEIPRIISFNQESKLLLSKTLTKFENSSLCLQKFFAVLAFALIAAASADVSSLRQYLPPHAGPAQAPLQLPSNQYIPPVAGPAAAPLPALAPAPAPLQQFADVAPAASFNEVDGYNYGH